MHAYPLLNACIKAGPFKLHSIFGTVMHKTGTHTIFTCAGTTYSTIPYTLPCTNKIGKGARLTSATPKI